MRVTLKAIARELGIDASTVSYALRGSGSINPETRRKVREAAERLGYVPSLAARQTSTGKSDAVAIVVPNVLAEYGEFCEHAFRIFCEKGFQTQILVTEFSAEREVTIARWLVGQNIAGALVVPSQPPEWIQTGSPSIRMLLTNRIPTVVRNRIPVPGEEGGAPSVNIDYAAIGRGLGERLRRSGCRDVRVAVPHPGPFFDNVKYVVRGLEESLGGNTRIRIESPAPEEARNGNPPGANLHYERQIRDLLSDGGIEAGRTLFRRIFQSGAETPDAVVCPHELCAIGLLTEAKAAGIRIPGQFELATCQRGVFSRIAPGRIAAGYVSSQRLATAMTARLLRLLDGEKNFTDEIISPEFDDGETLKPFPIQIT